MHSADWTRVRRILERALELEPTQRASFVSNECAGDDDLRREVEELLELEHSPELSPPRADDVAAALELHGSSVGEGRRVGAWRLVERLASGGMGTVWRGERADGTFEQRAAIKLIKRGMDTEDLLRRFSNERALLASLQHESIARLYDGGATDDGLPYLVMEFVDGRPIDEHCAALALDIRARIELFLRVCDAVQHAHQHLVLHRDLKPSNLLVTRGGTPKLLDFGIAKLLGVDGSESNPTRTAERVLTPAYASPEQLRGEALNAKSDVYSLGLILHELLTGAPAFDATRTPELEPPRPSASVERDGDSRRARALRGDLDTIVAAATRAEPERRYSSVDALAADLRRYLAGLPVLARRDTLGYRAQKFVRRNRVLVGAAATVFVLLAVAVAVSSTLYLREVAAHEREKSALLNESTALSREAAARELADRRFEDVHALAAKLLFDVHDSIRELVGSTKARELIATTALEYLDRLARDARGDERLRRDLADAYVRVAEIQGSPTGPSLGEEDAALASLDRVETLLDRDEDRVGVTALARADAARIRGLILQHLGRFDEAHCWFDEAVSRAEAAPQRDSIAPSQLFGPLAEVETHRAVEARDHGDLAGAREWIDRALVHAARLFEGGDRDYADTTWSMVQYERAKLRALSGDKRGALADELELVSTMSGLCAHKPRDGRQLANLASILHEVAQRYWELGDLDSAVSYVAQGIELAAELSGLDPHDATYTEIWVTALNKGGLIEHARGDDRAAVEDESLATSIVRASIAEHGDTRDRRWSLANALGSLAVAEVGVGAAPRAFEDADAALHEFEALSRAAPNSYGTWRVWTLTRLNLGEALLGAKTEALDSHWKRAVIERARDELESAQRALLEARDAGRLSPADARILEPCTKLLGDAEAAAAKLDG